HFVVTSARRAEQSRPFLKLIFDSVFCERVDSRDGIALDLRRGTTKRRLGVDQACAIWRRVGGRATPRAASARVAAGRGAERMRKGLPACLASVSGRHAEQG